MTENDHHRILIVGAEAAGIIVTASLRRRAPKALDMAIVEPSAFHDDRPAFTWVGAGAYPLSMTRQSEASLIVRNLLHRMKGALPIMYWNYMLKGREWFFSHDATWQEPTN